MYESNKGSHISVLLGFATVALLVAAPVFIINSHSIPSVLFYLLLASSLALTVTEHGRHGGEVLRRYWLVILAFTIPLGAVVNSALAYQHWPGANGEGAIRLILGMVLLLLALQYVRTWSIRQIAWGFVVAAIVSFVTVLFLVWPDFGRPETPGHIPVTYGAFMSLLAALSLFSIKWQLTPWHRVEIGLKLIASLFAFAALVLTQTRTGWLGVPIFIIIGVFLFFGNKNRARAAAALMFAFLLIGVVFVSNDVLRDKAVTAYNEAVECTGSGRTTNSSICVRFQMWRASLDMFSQNPWTGIGDGGLFRERMITDSHPKGIVSDLVVTYYFGEPHNDIIFYAAIFGVPGILALLMIYFVPALYFVRRMHVSLPVESRAAAAMGLAVCLGFAAFGLTELMFRRMHVIGFYAVFVAVLLVLSESNRQRI